MNGKYYPLYEYLSKQTDVKLILSFDELEEILGEKLPDSAHKYNAWRGNSKTVQHPYSRAWQEAGYETTNIESSRKLEQMTFIKTK